MTLIVDSSMNIQKQLAKSPEILENPACKILPGKLGNSQHGKRYLENKESPEFFLTWKINNFPEISRDCQGQ